MGRGRAKAKQTKVARELKYSSPTTDFDNLQRELSGAGQSPRGALLPDEPSQDSGGASRWDDDEGEWR
jgi:hypothetical protein